MLKFILPMLMTPLQLWNYHLMLFMMLSWMMIPMLYFTTQMKCFFFLFSLDPMSSPLILLTLWTTVLMVMASYKLMLKLFLTKEFISTITILTLTLVLAFSLNNMIMFYIMFEASLIPTLILILIWGYQPERLQAGMYLMLYTVTASLPLFASLMYILTKAKSLFFIPMFPNMAFQSILIPIMLSLAFLVKMPMYISHLWLPKAHVEAPVAGSMVLAGILLKLGSYGLLRLSMMFPMTMKLLLPPLMSISLFGASMTAIICIRQQDMKSLIAYSSVGHMALLIAGITSSTKWGWEGAIAMMIAHGLSSSCLFALANMYYETMNSRALSLTKGMLTMFPTMTMWWFLMSAANMAAPPTLNLLSEILLLTSILYSSFMMAPLLASAGFLAAAYSLYLFVTTHHGSNSQNTNSLLQFLPRNILTSFFHFFPLYFFILSASMITSWL